MDVDMLKSSPSSTTSTGGGGGGSDHNPHQELNMDILTMMMQMEKLKHPEFFDPTLHHQPSDHHHQQHLHFSNNNFYPQAPAPPFMGTPIQEQPMTNQNHHHHHKPLFSKYPPLVSNATSFISSMEKKNSTSAIREMIFRIAAMQPIHIDPESVKPPKRRNVKISKDPQSVAARHRRERISERIRILQRLVPGGTKMDTASMLDEAIHYVKFLKKQVQTLEQAGAGNYRGGGGGVANSIGAFAFGGGHAAAANFNLKNSSCTQPSAPNMVTTDPAPLKFFSLKLVKFNESQPHNHFGRLGLEV